jgi:hypothetical protein
MFSKSLMRLLLVGATSLMLVFVIAPAGFAASAGECSDYTGATSASAAGECPAPTDTTPAPVETTPADTTSSSGSSSSGSSDKQVAVGGVQTGAGGMASVSGSNVVLFLSIGGALILLSSVGAGGLAFRRR